MTVDETFKFAFDSMNGGTHGIGLPKEGLTADQKELISWMDSKYFKVNDRSPFHFWYIPSQPESAPPITFAAWKYSHGVSPPGWINFQKYQMIPPGIVDSLPGGFDFSGKKDPPPLRQGGAFLVLSQFRGVAKLWKHSSFGRFHFLISTLAIQKKGRNQNSQCTGKKTRQDRKKRGQPTPLTYFNTTQPYTMSSPCFPCHVRRLQHITFNQPFAPYATPNSPPPSQILSSEMPTEQSESPPPITFSTWNHSRVVFPQGRSACEQYIVDFPPGRTISAKQNPGKIPVATVHTFSSSTCVPVYVSAVSMCCPCAHLDPDSRT